MPPPTFDLSAHAEALGDPDAYFVDWQRDPMLVVEHATGEPKFVLGTDGTLTPYERPAADPRAAAVAGTVDHRADRAAAGRQEE